jgi:peptidoglycan/xylan/chitin deacetylase (PgdA/CDA1 family)
LGRVAAALCVAAGAAALAAPAGATVIHDRGDVHGPLDVKRASIEQSLHALTFKASVVGPIKPTVLKAKPSSGDRTPHYLCLVAIRSAQKPSKRLCFGRRRGDHPWKVGVGTFGPNGRLKSRHSIRPIAVQASKQQLVVRFDGKRAGMPAGRYRLHVMSAWSGAACDGTRCADRAPNRGSAGFRVETPHLVGCHDNGGGLFSNGSRASKRVALTFDDGPSAYTQSFVSTLASHHVFGTFFEVGQEVAGRSAAMRSALAHGDELGDHSYHHTQLPSESDIRATADRIQQASGFRPCDFRPPYGSYNSAEIDAARREGMSTITWDVDPADYSRPGSQAIYERVVSHVQPGSIVIMHDGGGDRSETLAALPRIIGTLKARGYKLVTISRLLGQKPKYKLG